MLRVSLSELHPNSFSDPSGTDYPHRVMSTRHPSVGGCEVTNGVTRRPSSSSQGSDGGGVKNMVKRFLNLPAY